MTTSRIRFGDLVLHNDHQFIACNKPATVPVQDDQSKDLSLLAMAQAYCKIKLFVVHRIDRPCSGVVIFAKNKVAAATISELFQSKSAEKEYLAVVYKGLTPQSGRLENDLAKVAPGKVAVVEGSKDGKSSTLTYEAIAEIDNYTLLRIRPETGRMHQIRVQLAHAGYPIKGDVKYGFRRANKDRSINLHCRSLKLKHPTKQTDMELLAPLPEDSVWNAFDFS